MQSITLTFGQWLTVWMIATAIIIGVIYDLFTAYNHGRDATISVVILTIAKEWPIIPLLVGILIGHIFWPQ